MQAGAFIGSFLLVLIGIIELYESYVLLKGSRAKQEYINRNEIVENARSEGREKTDRRSVHAQTKLIFLESVIGFGIGVLGGLVGLVLGSISMPAMISILKMEPRVAVGTNLAAFPLWEYLD